MGTDFNENTVNYMQDQDNPGVKAMDHPNNPGNYAPNIEEGAANDAPRGRSLTVFKVLTSVTYQREGGATVIHAVKKQTPSLLLVAFSSLIVLIAFAPGAAFAGIFAYGVALGAASFAAIMLYLLIFYLKETSVSEKSLFFLSAFLSVWWVVGVLVTTFAFAGAGTAYFSAWAALFFSLYVLSSEIAEIQKFVAAVKSTNKDNLKDLILLLASATVVLASSISCGTGLCPGETIYGIIAGIVTGIMALVLMLRGPTMQENHLKALVISLALIWTVTLGVLTLKGPFVAAGNGLFACYAGFFVSYFMAEHYMPIR